MPINEIYEFAKGGTVENGDVLLLENYLEDVQRTSGHQPGIARQALMNTNLRQVTHMAAGLAQFIANRYAPGVVDDGNLVKVEAGLVSAIVNIIGNTPHDHLTADVTDLLDDSHQWAKGQRYTQAQLQIISGEVTWDMGNQPVAFLILSDDVHQFTVTNYKAGATYELSIKQLTGGGKFCVMPAAFRWPEGKAHEVTTTRWGEDIINVSVRSYNGVVVPRAYSANDFRVVS